MKPSRIKSDFLNYIITNHLPPHTKLPTLVELSEEIGVSVGKLREQLEVARMLGIVTVRPHNGTIREPFNFAATVRLSAFYGLETGEANFAHFSQLRQTLETSLWPEAVVRLTDEDKQQLRAIVAQAWDKLLGDPIHVPNAEHRQLHLTIFSRLDNPFVRGILETYWDLYEATELTRWVSYEYWLEVWRFHQQIVEAICQNDFGQGQQLLLQHFSLLPKS